MNPDLQRLQPYPFQKLAKLLGEVTPNAAFKPISLHIGEPKHATPQFIKDALVAGSGRAGELSHNHRQRRIARRHRQLAGTTLRYSGARCEDADPAGERQPRSAVLVRPGR